MNTKHRVIFPVLVAMLPALLILLLEGTLVLFGLFSQEPLFRGLDDDPATLQINSEVGKRYFNERVMSVPNLYPQTFDRIKPENTVRIFCMGGSTTAGFPYEMTVPFPEQLEILLNLSYPDREMEVINLGLSAVNSFTVLDWIPEVLDQDPDLILIYMGHNEFYGAYGTGSTISYGHNPHLIRFLLKLKKMRVYQMVRTMVNMVTPSATPGNNETVMEKIIADAFIAGDSELRQITHNNFQDNLKRILASCNDDDVPVILSTLVSNLRDQAPLGEDDPLAQEAFKNGHLNLSRGDTLLALSEFMQAKDLDVIPFRAHSAVNSIIKEESQNSGSRLINMAQVFASHSPDGIPGRFLICDHLHPNPKGYHLMARAFHDEIVSSEAFGVPARIIPNWNSPLFVTPIDWEIGQLKIFKLEHRWPFGNKEVDYDTYAPLTDSLTSAIAQDYLFNHSVWGRAHGDMARQLIKQGRIMEACNEYDAIIHMYPDKLEFHQALIQFATQAGDWPRVERTCRLALALTDARGMYLYHLAIAERMQGKMGEAMRHIQEATLAPELTRGQSSQIYFTLARFLLEINQREDALEVLEGLLEQVPDFKPARDLLAQITNN